MYIDVGGYFCIKKVENKTFWYFFIMSEHQNRFPLFYVTHGIVNVEKFAFISDPLSDFLVFPDINECLTSNHGCGRTQKCVNTIGSFKCQCQPGYEAAGPLCVGKTNLFRPKN